VEQIITDAELVAKFAEQAMKEPEKVIETRAPSESVVTLPGGYITNKGELLTTAEVRELNGLDEEIVAKSGSTAKSLTALLQRGLVSLGSEEITKEHIDNLLSGDRDAILIGIRRATFGETIDLNAQCPHCSERQVLPVHLIDDVPVKELKDKKEDRSWVVKTKQGDVVVSLPTGSVQKRLMDNMDKTVAEINTLLLAGCVLSVEGRPSSGASTALSFGMADRTKIIDSILERNPGPRLGEVTKACQACGEDIPLPLGLTDLFRV
jgi:hypothetical protein